jgi:hypothetical protein
MLHLIPRHLSTKFANMTHLSVLPNQSKDQLVTNANLKLPQKKQEKLELELKNQSQDTTVNDFTPKIAKSNILKLTSDLLV